MKHSLILTAFILFYITAFSQNSLKKPNLITWAEASFGFPITGNGGLQVNLELNYQVNKSLLTARFTNIAYFSFTTVEIAPFFALPVIKDNGSLDEYSLLYGLRFINGGHSFSFSGGVSYNNRVINYTDANNQRQSTDSKYPGVPFEANVLWFKAKKRRYHIDYLIPVGKPTGFGHSFGFKLSGNLSQHSYVSLGMVFGLGDHRDY